MRNPQSLIDKIKALPPDRIDEVEDFIDFIASRAQGSRAYARRCRDERARFCKNLE